MSTREAVLSDIVAHPDDDAPRLVFADWLDDAGEPERGELIRVQCALARLPEGDPSRPELTRREAELLEAHARDWAEPLRGLVEEFRYSRGFVEAVEMRDDRTPDFAGHLGQVLALAPVRRLRVRWQGMAW